MSGAPSLARLVALSRTHGKPDCLVVPGAGGGIQPYMPLSEFLAAGHNVHLARTLGLLPGEKAQESVAEMVDDILDALMRKRIRPDLIVGWSMGGVLGWEIGARLAAGGAAPDLVMIDASPHPWDATPEFNAFVLRRILGMLGPTPNKVTEQLVSEVFWAQIRAMSRHSVRVSYPGRVLLLSCDDGAMSGSRAAAITAWRSLAPRFTLEHLDAGHFDILQPEHSGQLAAALHGFLDDSDRVTAAS